MKKEFENEFYRCDMPLSDELLKEIDIHHRNRPFYMLLNDERTNRVFALACTSKQRGKEITEYDILPLENNSSIRLNRVYWFRPESIDQKTYQWNMPPLSKQEYDDLMKRMFLSGDFKEYPAYVRKVIKEYMKTCDYNFKDILKNYLKDDSIIVKKVKGIYEGYKVSFVPLEGYTEFIASGTKCYVDLSKKITRENLDGYRLVIHTDYFSESLRRKEKQSTNQNISTLQSLPVGTFIRTIENGIEYNLIKLESTDSLQFIKGEKGTRLRDYKVVSYDLNQSFDYRFLYIVTEQKLNYIRYRKIRG